MQRRRQQQRCPGRRHARQLGQRALAVLHVLDDVERTDQVKGVRVEGQ